MPLNRAQSNMVSIAPVPAAGHNTFSGMVMNSNTTGYTVALIVPFNITVNRISLRTGATASTAGTIALGLYSENGQTRQFTVSVPSITANNTTYTASVAGVTLTPAIYYAVAVPQNTADVNLVGFGLGNVRFESSVLSEPVLGGTLTVTANTLPTTFAPVTDIASGSPAGPGIRLDN